MRPYRSQFRALTTVGGQRISFKEDLCYFRLNNHDMTMKGAELNRTPPILGLLFFLGLNFGWNFLM